MEIPTFSFNDRQRKSLAKRNHQRAAFNQKRAKPHAQYNTWNPYKATYIDRASSSKSAVAWNCKGRPLLRTVVLRRFSGCTNQTRPLDIIQSIRFNASRSENFKYPQSKTLLPWPHLQEKLKDNPSKKCLSNTLRTFTTQAFQKKWPKNNRPFTTGNLKNFKSNSLEKINHRADGYKL